MTAKKTTTARARRTPFHFSIEITSGGRDSRTSRRELSYLKPPRDWTAMDLLNVARAMARTAAKVRRVKVADKIATVNFQLLDGGTEMTVSQASGAWAFIRGRSLIHIPYEAIAGLVGVSETCYSASLRIPGVLVADPRAVRRKHERMLRTMALVTANIEAEMATDAVKAGAR